MKSCLVYIIIIIVSFHSIAEDEVNCSENELNTGKLFQLDIKTSFSGSYEYIFCVSKKDSFLLSTYTEPLYQNLPDLTYKSKVKLSKKIGLKLKAMYQQSVIGLPSDKSQGLDGSIWCFRPKSGLSYSKFCYWSPDFKALDRGFVKLVDLRLYIHKLSGLN